MTDSFFKREIEVGATADEIRYWLAKEALRQGELGITSQIAALDAMMSRATSIFGWSVTTTIALAGVALWPGQFRFPAIGALLYTFAAAISCVCALWPRRWVLNGYDPDMVRKTPYESELEVLESLAMGLALGKQQNAAATARVAIYLRIAWLTFCLSPLAGGSVAVIAQALQSGHVLRSI